ncbi:hypothetical protein [Alsobacter sp. R-9]
MLKIGILAISTALLVPVADEAPRWDIAASCRASTGAANGTGEKFNGCVKDETAARDQIAKVWAAAKPGMRNTCVGAQTQAARSYVALMTCMQIADATLPWKK